MLMNVFACCSGVRVFLYTRGIRDIHVYELNDPNNRYIPKKCIRNAKKKKRIYILYTRSRQRTYMDT